MKGKRSMWLLFALFLFGISAGLFVETFVADKNHREIDHPLFERAIQRRQMALNKMLKNFPSHLLQSEKSIWSVMDSVNKTSSNTLLVYDGNRLIAWSDQSVPVSEVHPVFFNQPVIKLQNGWYLLQKIQTGPFSLVGLSLIKHDYPYENKFLSNDFGLSPTLDKEVNISNEQRPGYIPIYGLEGEYLFSLSTLRSLSDFPSANAWALLFYFTGILSLWLFLNKWMKRKGRLQWTNLYLAISMIVFSSFYLVVFWVNDLALFDNLGLFSPVHFAMSKYLPSLGALLLLSLLFSLLSCWVFWFFRLPRFFLNRNSVPTAMGGLFFILFLLVEAWLLFIVKLIYHLVEHSSGPSIFFKVLELNGIAIVKVAVIALLFFSFVLMADKSVRLFTGRLSKGWMVFLMVLATVVIMGIAGGKGYGSADWSLVFAGSFGVFLLLVRRNPGGRHTYNTFVWGVGLFAVFSGSMLIHLTLNKEEMNRELLVENLSFQLLREEDPVAEMYLEDIEERILRDVSLRQQLAQSEVNQPAIRDHLLKYYFYGYWGRYDLQIVPCWPKGNLLLEETGERYNCYQYFFETIHEQGHLIEGNDHFYYLDNDNGRVSYLGVFRFFQGHSLETTLFIELHSKPFFEGLGYPELLISRREQERLQLFSDYSYAKYVEGKLVKRSGDYSYKSKLREIYPGSQRKMFVKDAGYSHLLFRPEPGVVVILSRADMALADIFIAISMLFILYFISGILFFGLIRLQYLKSFRIQLSIQKRIQITFVVLLLVLLSLVAVGTVLYTVKQFKTRHTELLDEKVKSVLLEMEWKIGTEGPLQPDMRDYLTYHLQTISNIFFCDINLFTPDGMLLASSRPELFQKGLIGDQMNPGAFYSLTYGQSDRYLNDESIGGLKYTSFYVPFLNRDDELLGYLNVPYFVANNELKEEVSSVIVTVVNFYLLFSFLVVALAVFLARQITRPLLVIQSKLAEVKIDRHNEKIDYQGDDEIGSLVAEYNRMVDELSESATKLAQTERELAWREMARQIAHEIKNPLTPMKLSIQYLQRAWNDRVPDFDDFLKRVTNTLIEQIEALSSIAREFSHFAKMPAARLREVDLLDRIKKSTTLFENLDNVSISKHFNRLNEVVVMADPEQLLRVFNNLIYNAIQAIPAGKEGKVSINVGLINEKAVVEVKDNGKGIAEEDRKKMFVPNFTTKTSGTGLGLAIVKSAVESAGGSVWFDSEPGVGTTFYVELPVVSHSSL